MVSSAQPADLGLSCSTLKFLCSIWKFGAWYQCFPRWVILSFVCRMSVPSVSSHPPLNTAMFFPPAKACCNFCFTSACVFGIRCQRKLSRNSGLLFQLAGLMPIRKNQSDWIMSLSPRRPHLMQAGFLLCIEEEKLQGVLCLFKEGESEEQDHPYSQYSLFPNFCDCVTALIFNFSSCIGLKRYSFISISTPPFTKGPGTWEKSKDNSRNVFKASHALRTAGEVREANRGTQCLVRASTPLLKNEYSLFLLRGTYSLNQTHYSLWTDTLPCSIHFRGITLVYAHKRFAPQIIRMIR